MKADVSTDAALSTYHTPFVTITFNLTPYHLVWLCFVSVACNVYLLLRLCRGTKKVINGTPVNNGRVTRLRMVSAPTRSTSQITSSPPFAAPLATGVEHLEKLFVGRRYLEAGALLESLRAAQGRRASDAWPWNEWGADEAWARLQALLSDGHLEERVAMCRDLITDLDAEDGFEVVSEDESRRVLQRIDDDDPRTDGRMLTVRVEAVLEGVNPSDCLLIWREAELYPSWFPFVSGGKMLGELHPAEAILQLFVDTSFMNVDMALWGFAVDNMAHDGTLLLCVRPVTSDTALPKGCAPPDKTGSRSFKLLGSIRAEAFIDIRIEPLSAKSARITFQMAGELPPLAPAWTFNYIVQNAMTNIFHAMKGVATRMAANDPTCQHAHHVARPSYAPTKEWYQTVVDSGSDRWPRA